MQRSKLRIGVLVDDIRLPAWEHLAIQKIVDSDCAEIVLVVLKDARTANANSTDTRGRVSTWLGSMLRRSLNVLMERGADTLDATKYADASGLLGDLPLLTVVAESDDRGEALAPGDIARIKKYELDVMVKLGFGNLKGEILTVSRYGVWSYQHGDSRVNRGGPPGFWETMESWPETGSMLQILAEKPGANTVLYRSWSCTDTTSVAKNNASRYWTAASFLLRVLRRLYTLGTDAFFREVGMLNRYPEPYSSRVYGDPDNGVLIRLLCKKAIEKMRRKIWSKFYFNQWFLLFDFQQYSSAVLPRFNRIVPPRDRFWADPFVYCKDGTYFVFIEEFTYESGKGHIAVFAMDSQGNYDSPVPVIEESHHLSYPFLFDYGGSLYMVAEALESNAVPLYRCEEFPGKWVFVRNLLENLAAVDPTLHFKDGLWYLFVGVAENPGSSTWDELFLYFSTDPVQGQWTSHPLNPIVSDVKSARPAGRLFEHKGKWYRPSQNSSHHYGYGFNFGVVSTLNKFEYEEEIVSTVGPNWSKDIVSIHTISASGPLTFVDAQLRRARYW